MEYRGITGGQYQPLSDEDVRKVCRAAFAILERTGFVVEEEHALELFKTAGVRVAGKRVRLSSMFIEDIIDRTPKCILLAGRANRHDIVLEGNRVYIGSGGAALKVMENGVVRDACLRDVALFARLVDALDNIHFYLVPVYPAELGSGEVDINTFYNAISNTTKHVQAGVYSIQGIRDVIEMAELIGGGKNSLRARPFVSFITSWMISPLRFNLKVTKLLIECCRKRMPVVLSSAPMAGVTAPVTLAGLLAQLTAEQLAGISLTQLVSPGTPVISGPVPAIADMRTGGYLAGTPEMGLLNAAISQVLHSYGLPLYNSSGMTDSKIGDMQAGFEKAMSLVVDALAGANYIHHAAGLLENMSTVSAEQFVIDNEIIGMALRVLRGIEVNDETLAVDVIDRVGPGGNYLMEDFTIHHMRGEFFYPSSVISRELRALWESQGKSDAWERAYKRTVDILKNHKPKPIDRGLDSAIRERFKPIAAF
jgi:trimethylamine--corrinoid protein Co-methyltransferase